MIFTLGLRDGFRGCFRLFVLSYSVYAQIYIEWLSSEAFRPTEEMGGNKILSHLSVQICVPNFSSSGYEHSAVWVRQRRWVSCKVFFYFLTKCRPCVTIPPLKLSKETLKGTKSNCNSRRSLSDFGNFPFWSLIFISSQIGIAVHFVAKGCYSQLCCNLFM